MSVLAPGEIPTAEQLLVHRERIVRLGEAFRLLGRGAKQRAAFDLRVSPTRVAYTLSCKHIDMELATKLDSWISQQEISEGVTLP